MAIIEVRRIRNRDTDMLRGCLSTSQVKSQFSHREGNTSDPVMDSEADISVFSRNLNYRLDLESLTTEIIKSRLDDQLAQKRRHPDFFLAIR